MAVWDQLFRKMVGPVINEEIKKVGPDLIKGEVSKRLSPALQPWEYTPVLSDKVKKKPFPLGVDFDTLRNLAVFYPIARACVNYRKAQITQLDWEIAPIEVGKKKQDDSVKEECSKLKELFNSPTGDSTVSFRTFLNRILEDVLVIDALALYRKMNRGGGIIGYLPVDGATIELRVNPDGTTPAPPEYAYIQNVRNFEAVELTTDEMIYQSMNPRTSDPYGLSPLETLVLTVTTALKLQAYNLGYLSEGNIPDGLIELPKDIAGSRDQLKDWQDAWDAMLSGDPRFQRKLKFLPEGMKYHPTRKLEEMTFERFEKWLLLQTCSVFAVPPQAIGFQFDRGKGATEAEWEIGKERGLFPTANFIKEIFDRIIQDDFGKKHLQFVFTNINPTNKAEEAKVFDVLVRSGAVSVDEWRIGEGLKAIGLAHYIMTPVGPIMVKDLVRESEAGGRPVLPYTPQVKLPIVPKDKEPIVPKEKLADESFVDQVKEVGRLEAVDELRKWKKTALNDFKQGKDFREFQTDKIDVRTQELLKKGLGSAKSRADVVELFRPFIASENRIVSAVLDLYDDVTRAVSG